MHNAKIQSSDLVYGFIFLPGIFQRAQFPSFAKKQRMGIVVRQTFYGTLAAYVGVILGYINVVILMPLYMKPEEIGLMRAVNSIAMLMVPLVLAGTASTLIKFYPKVGSDLSKLYGFCFTLIFMSFSLVFVLSLLFQGSWYSIFSEKSPQINHYFLFTYILLFSMGIFNFLEASSRVAEDVVTPNFLREIVYKGGHTLIIFLTGWGILSFQQYMYGHLLIYLLLIGALFYIIRKKIAFNPDFRKVFNQPFSKEAIPFSLFSIIGGFSIMMVLQIDQIMISSMLGLSENSIYTTAAFMAVVIELPRRLVSQITLPIISKAYNEKRFEDINTQYQSVSIHLLLLGSLLFLLITLNLDSIYSLMPNGSFYQQGFWVVYLVGLTKMVDMIFSVNGEIISMSSFYKFNVFLILGLGFLTVVSNYIFIPIYGIEGAAVATLITYVLFNISKYVLLKIKYGFEPFRLSTIYLLLVIAFGFFSIRLIPIVFPPLIDIFLRTSVILGFFSFVVFILKPSPELIELLEKLKNKILSRK